MNKRVPFIKGKFAEELRRCCVERYSQIPSNEKLAKDFYFSTNYSLNVNRETFRKWLKGESFPDLDYLVHLIHWLKLDMRNIFENSEKDTPHNELELAQLDVTLKNNLNLDSLNSMISIINLLKTKINN